MHFDAEAGSGRGDVAAGPYDDGVDEVLVQVVRELDGAAIEAAADDDVIDERDMLRVLAEASVAVLHGGTNSLNEAIWSGVPSLVVPFMADQFDGAVCVQRAGAGRELLLGDMTVASVAQALEELLAPSVAQRTRMAELQRSYLTADGNARAVDAIERMATASRPSSGA